MKAMYEVTSEEVRAKLEKEVWRKNNFLKGSLDRIQKLVDGVETLAYYVDSWDGGVCLFGVVFTKEAEKHVDSGLWKKASRQAGDRTAYVPKKNSKKGKELAKALDLKKEVFFNGFEDDLRFHPAQREEFKSGYLILNRLAFGYAMDGDKYRFVFNGYEGYEPPEGVAKEMLVSEYNQLFGK